MVESHLVIILNDGEHYIPDPMETTSPHAEKMQKSVDRARAQAHRLMHKATAELRKLQTERHFRQQNAEAESDLPQAQAIGLADTQALAKTPRPSAKPRVTQRTQSHPAEAAGSAQTTDSQPETQPEIVLAA
jgi:vacuolar-type H+-ATPase subunit H